MAQAKVGLEDGSSRGHNLDLDCLFVPFSLDGCVAPAQGGVRRQLLVVSYMDSDLDKTS